MRFRFSTALLLLTASFVNAQVASHKPSVAAKQARQRPAQGQNMAGQSAVAVSDKPVARVNGVVLTEHDLLNEMYAIFPYARQHNGGFPKGMEGEIRRGALDMIIFEELVYQDAQQRKMEIPAVRLKKAQAEFRKQFQSDQEFRQYLQFECKGSEKVLQQRLRRSLLIDSFLKKEVGGRAAVSSIEAKAYFDKNRKEFWHGDSVHIQTISIIPPQNPGTDYDKEAHKKAEDALTKAKATKSYREFGLLAEQLSDDDWHVNMGDRKDVDASTLPPPIVAAARKMQAGQVSELFHFGPNYAFFRLVSFTPAHADKFAAVKSKICSDLQKVKYEKSRIELGQRLRKGAKVELL